MAQTQKAASAKKSASGTSSRKQTASAAKSRSSAKSSAAAKRSRSAAAAKTSAEAAKKTAAAKKPIVLQKSKTPVYDFPIAREIGVLVCIALAVILFLSSFDTIDGDLGWLKQLNFGLFGWFGYASPLVFCFLSLFIAANLDHFGRKPKIKCAGIGLLTVACCALLQDIRIAQLGYAASRDFFVDGYEYGGGGMIGGIVMVYLDPLLGPAGSGVLLFCLLLIALMIVTEVSMKDVAKWIQKLYKTHQERQQQRREQEARYVEELQLRRQAEQNAKIQAEQSTDKQVQPEKKSGRVANVDLKKEEQEYQKQKLRQKGELGVPSFLASKWAENRKKKEEEIPVAAMETADAAAAPYTSPQEETPAVDENRKNSFYQWILQKRKAEQAQAQAEAVQDEAHLESRQQEQDPDLVIMAKANGGARKRGGSQAQTFAMPEGDFVQSKMEFAEPNASEPTKESEPLPWQTESAVAHVAESSTGEVDLDTWSEEAAEAYDAYQDFPVQAEDKYSSTAGASAEKMRLSAEVAEDKYSNTAGASAGADSTIVVETAGGKKIVVERDSNIAPAKKRTIAYTGPGATTEKDPKTRYEGQTPAKPSKPYVGPALKLLSKTEAGMQEKNRDMELAETAALLEQTFKDFGVGVEVTDYSCGPTVTRYELTPAQGVKVSRITALTDDVKLKLAATDIRIEAPIPGKSAVGIEVPNKENSTVLLGDLIGSSVFQKHPSKIAFAVGKDIGGKVIVFDIARMPHLLIAGATGSGKSVCINTLIVSILYKATPDEVKLIMIDPKVVELSVYNGIPHLAKPVVTDARKASSVLNWSVAEMTRRYHKFAETNTRDIAGYNKHIMADPQLSEEEKKAAKLPQMVIIVDELADLMMVAPNEVEDAICRLAQMARAAGIHLVLATQRPSVNVITGLIKANVPSRIAFSVSSGVDSRTIIDMVGAEKLLGKGDMLFYPFGYNKPVRVQGAFVSDQEVTSIVEALTKNNDSYVPAADVDDEIELELEGEGSAVPDLDEYFVKAGLFLIEKDKGSIGLLQRMFRIGFNRAARIMDQLAQYGVVGEEEGTKPRQILMTREQFETLLSDNGIS